jgi:aminotransferase in exopolysaccharide biosynthesis
MPQSQNFRQLTINMFNQIIKFIREIYQTDNPIPLHQPHFGGNEKRYIEESIDSTFVSSVGRFVDLFENKVAEYTGAKYAVACVNGTAALHMALLLCDVKQEDEVITQPLTFIATANAIAYTGAHPVFLDVDLDTLGLSPAKVQQFLEEFGELRDDGFCYNKKTGRRISACVPMHTFGLPVKIESLVSVCNRYNIPVIEDAAESLGSTYSGKHTGTFGKLGILSFNGNKIITTGGGGMILTNDEKSGKMAKHLTTQSRIPHPWEYVHDHIGYNYRMPNINAALGLAQMEQLDNFIDKKKILHNLYGVFFKNNSISFIVEPHNASSNFWLNCILLNDTKERDDFLKISCEKGVMTRPAWQLMNKLFMFENCQRDDLSHAKWLQDRIVNIPSSINYEKSHCRR